MNLSHSLMSRIVCRLISRSVLLCVIIAGVVKATGLGDTGVKSVSPNRKEFCPNDPSVLLYSILIWMNVAHEEESLRLELDKGIELALYGCL